MKEFCVCVQITGMRFDPDIYEDQHLPLTAYQLLEYWNAVGVDGGKAMTDMREKLGKIASASWPSLCTNHNLDTVRFFSLFMMLLIA